MRGYEGARAIVTGAASGIGLALARGLVARGAEVWLTDIDAAGVKGAAEALGSRAHAAELDVRDANEVAYIVGQVADAAGGLDFLFNNAGMGVAGETQEMGVEHFDRTVDINIRGVTNGVVAAYPRMVARGRGHIVNTASAAGLLPVPLMTAYAMSKHAVVGLSESLRLEAAHYGVRVSALCPTAIETPLLDSEGPSDLPRPWRPDLRRYLSQAGRPPQPVEAFADYALTCIARNRGLIVSPASARIAVLANRLFPALVRRIGRKALEAELREKPKS